MPTLTDLARDERSARMVLSIVGTPNHAPTGHLIMRVGAVDTVAFIENDHDIPGMDDVEAAVWRERARSSMSSETVARVIADGEPYRFITPVDPEWPVQLSELDARAPYGLWACGNLEYLTGHPQKMVTFDGARAATSYGEEVTKVFTADLAFSKYTIVSGGAFGIEGAAHRGALSGGGGTIAVLASGVNRAYPSAHAELFERIRQNGVLVSENAPGVSPTRQRFLDRARLLAGFSAATVIVEAGVRSGAMLTANEARDLDRLVGAVPGPVMSAASYGPNLLLQQGRAHVVTDAADIRDLTRHGQITRTSPLLSARAPEVTRESPGARTL